MDREWRSFSVCNNIKCVLFLDFGHRPRRLYIMINPTAGNRAGLSTWAKVEHLFQISNVHTEIFSELIY